ncbi:hypothetical protein ACOSQ2_023796 [Xanthoceras sorbifolium]
MLEPLFFMLAATSTLDGIRDTVSAAHPLLPLMGLLKTNGKLVHVGAPEKPPELPVFPLLMERKIVAGSATRGMKENQEMSNFAAKYNMSVDIEEWGPNEWGSHRYGTDHGCGPKFKPVGMVKRK